MCSSVSKFVTTSTYLFFVFYHRVTNRHGHWVYWISMGGKSSSILNTHVTYFMFHAKKGILCLDGRPSRHRAITKCAAVLGKNEINWCGFITTTHGAVEEQEGKRTRKNARTAGTDVKKIIKTINLKRTEERKLSTWYSMSAKRVRIPRQKPSQRRKPELQH